MQKQELLIKRFQKKNQQAFSKIYDDYSAAIFGVILRMCQSRELAEELLHDTFLTAWNKSDNYDSKKGSLYTWLYRIAKNKTLNALRSKKNFIQTEDLSVYNFKEDQTDRETDLQLNGQLNQLEPHHKKAIELVYFQGLTHREAYKEMDVPLGTFKSYIRQALKKLKENVYKASLIILILMKFWNHG